MLSESLKRKLAKLNTGNPHSGGITRPESANPDKKDFTEPVKPFFEPMNLEEAADGDEYFTEDGPFFRVKKTLDEIDEEILFDNGRILRSVAAVKNEEHSVFISGDIRKAAGGNNPTILFFDLETCGFSGTPVFLIGFLSAGLDGVVFEQAFARDYSEERHIVSYFAERFEKTDIVSTFNGKSFDYPFITERGYHNGIRIRQNIPHLDLLHISRRKWGEYLPNCKLVTLEQYILKRNRINDIPGSDIPDVYHNYVDSGDAFRMKEVLYHNMMDVITLAEIFTRIFV